MLRITVIVVVVVLEVAVLISEQSHLPTFIIHYPLAFVRIRGWAERSLRPVQLLHLRQIMLAHEGIRPITMAFLKKRLLRKFALMTQQGKSTDAVVLTFKEHKYRLSSNVSQEYPYVKLSSDLYYGSHVPTSPQTPPPTSSLSKLTPAEALSRALSTNLLIERPSSRNSSYRGDESPILSPTASLILESCSIASTLSGSGNGKDYVKDGHAQVASLPNSATADASDPVGKQRRRGGKRKTSTGQGGRVKKSLATSLPSASSGGKGGGGVAWTIFKLLGCAFAVGFGSYIVVKWLRPMIRL